MKKNIFKLFILIGVLLITSCSSDTDDLGATSTNQQKSAVYTCTELYHDQNLSDNNTKAVIRKNAKWDNGTTIKVKFLNGSSYLQNKVRKYALEWTYFANIKFQFVDFDDDADVRVAFKWNGDTGSWSYVGTDCRYINQDKPTVNFGWFEEYTFEEEFSRTILHEFGHVLGLKHEHQHPTNPIQWNKPVVYKYYERFGWDKDTVDKQIFEKLNTTQTNYGAYDKTSIMHYNLDESWTFDGFFVELNTILSDVDKQFIAEQYPEASTNLPTIQEAWVDKGFFTWTDETKTALVITELGAKQKSLPDVSDGGQLTSAHGMFVGFGPALFEKAPYFETYNITDFSEMFLRDHNMLSIPHYDTSNGKDFSSMFYLCQSLEAIPLLNTSKGTNFNSMFAGASDIKSIPLLDTSNGTDFEYMFFYCMRLTFVPDLNTSNGTKFKQMFFNCHLDSRPNLDTSKATDLEDMYNYYPY